MHSSTPQPARPPAAWRRWRYPGAALLAVAAIAGSLAYFSAFKDQPVQTNTTHHIAKSQDGTPIAYTRQGAGPPLVLVDGAFCFRQNGPAPELAALLAQHFTVYTYDRRGRGESGDMPPYAIAREVEDLQAVLAQAAAPAHALGVSSGGALVLQAAASGANLKKLALYEPPFVKDGGRPRAFAGAAKRIAALVARGDRRGAVSLFMTDVFGAPRVFVFVMPFLMRSAWQHNEAVAQTLPYDLALMDDWSVLADKQMRIKQPTLVISGEKSPPEMREAMATVVAALPHASAKLLEGQSHNLSPNVLAPVLKAYFLAD